MRLLGRPLTLVVALALLAATFLVGRGLGPDDRRLTATFPSTVSLYEGAKVKVLGVDVGQVESIEVRGTAVQVEITYDGSLDLPADVHALVVPPSIVGDRFVQLAPVYESGPRLEDGAELGLDRTSVPLELDDTYRGLDDLAAALGPEGANADGALSRLVSATAGNLGGNGRRLNETIRQLSAAISTLATSSEDFQGTVGNVERLTRTFARDDDTVRALVTNLALVSAELNGQRDDIGRSVRDLSSALEDVARFTERNRGAIKGSITGIRDVTTTLSRHIGELETLTEVAPVGLVGLMNIYVPRNWDPENPEGTVIAGRTGSQALRAATLNDLSIQLGYTLSAVCDSLPPEQATQIGAFCTALREAGGDLGAVISGAAESGPGGLLDPTALDLARAGTRGGSR